MSIEGIRATIFLRHRQLIRCAIVMGITAAITVIVTPLLWKFTSGYVPTLISGCVGGGLFLIEAAVAGVIYYSKRANVGRWKKLRRQQKAQAPAPAVAQAPKRPPAKDFGLPSDVLAHCAGFLEDGRVAVFRRVCKNNYGDSGLIAHYAKRLTPTPGASPAATVALFNRHMSRVRRFVPKSHLLDLRLMIKEGRPMTTANFVAFFSAVKNIRNLRTSWTFISPYLMNRGEVRAMTDLSRSWAFSDAFIQAAQWGNIAFGRMLLSHGVDVNSRGGIFNSSAIHVAVQLGNRDYVAFLLNSGADANCARTFFSRPPLYHAVEGGHIAVVQLLLDSGADREARFGENDSTVLSLCRDEGTLDLLLRYEWSPNDLMDAREAHYEASQTTYVDSDNPEKERALYYQLYCRLDARLPLENRETSA